MRIFNVNFYLSLVLTLLCFFPVVKYFLPLGIFVQFLPLFLLVFIAFIHRSNLTLSNNLTYCLIMCLVLFVYGISASFFWYSTFTIPEILRYLNVFLLGFLIYITGTHFYFKTHQLCYFLSISSILCLVYFINHISIVSDNLTYSQISYTSLPLVCLGLSKIYSKRYIIGFFLLFFGLSTSFFFGSRATLIFVVFVIIAIFGNQKKIILPLVIIASPIALLIYNIIMNSSKDFLVIARFVRLMNDFSEEPRAELFSVMIKWISNNLFGYGFGNQEVFSGAHPHSLLLEFMLTFGVFLGVPLFVILISLVFRAFLNFGKIGAIFEQSMLSFHFLIWQVSNDFGSSYFLIGLMALGLSIGGKSTLSTSGRRHEPVLN